MKTWKLQNKYHFLPPRRCNNVRGQFHMTADGYQRFNDIILNVIACVLLVNEVFLMLNNGKETPILHAAL